jgi:hypothetical protein
VVSEPAVPAARADVAAATVDGATVVHHAGRVHSLDPIATLVWRCCDGRASVDDIAADLAPAFAVPLDRARHDVATAVAELERLDLLVAPRGDARSEGEELVADPPGSCASCADRDWPATVRLRIGPRLVEVGSGAAVVDAAIRAALPAHVVAGSGAPSGVPPFLAVDSPPVQPPLRPLHLLHRGDTVLARSRTVGDAVRALAAYLAPLGDLAGLGLAAVDGWVVTGGDRALIVAEAPEAGRRRRELVDAGLRVSDVAVAVVDGRRGEAVVGAPGLEVVDGALDPTTESVVWGRYPLAGLVVAGRPDPAVAFLTFAPARDDQRDHDANLAALATLVESVPVVTAVDADAIASHLR